MWKEPGSILSEKEWEREKAMNLHLCLMRVCVQSIGVCVSAGAPSPPARRSDIHRETPVSLCEKRENFEIKLCPLKSPLGRGCLIWECQRRPREELALGLWVGMTAKMGPWLGVDQGFVGPEAHTVVRALFNKKDTQ